MSKLTFFNEVYAKLESCLPQIKTVELYNSQPDNTDKEEAKFYPAVYLEMSDIDWVTKGLGIQQGEISLTVYVVTENYKTDDRTFLTTVDEVYSCLNGLQSCSFTALERVSERQDTDHDQLSIWEIDFRSTLYDSQDNSMSEMTVTTIDPKTGLVVGVDLDIDNDTIRTGDGDFS